MVNAESSSIAAVSFDLDGTLVDSLADLHAAVNRMLASLQRPTLNLARIRGLVGAGERDLIRQSLRATDAANGEPDDAEMDAARDGFRSAYQDENGRRACLYPGVVEALVRLQDRGLALAVVTNKPAMFTGPLLAALDVARYFPVVVSGDSTAERKPHPLPLLTACRRMDVSVSATVHVGDSGIDVATAQAAGCPVVFVGHGYPRDYQPPPALPVIAGFDGLLPMLARLEVAMAASTTR